MINVIEAKFAIYRREGADLYAEGIYESFRDAINAYKEQFEQKQLKFGVEDVYFIVNLKQFEACKIWCSPVVDFRHWKRVQKNETA